MGMVIEINHCSSFFFYSNWIGNAGNLKYAGEFPASLLFSDSHHHKSSTSPAQSQIQLNHHPTISTVSCLPAVTTTTTTFQVNLIGAAAAAQFLDSKSEVADRDRNSPGSDSSTHSIRYEFFFFPFTHLKLIMSI